MTDMYYGLTVSELKDIFMDSKNKKLGLRELEEMIMDSGEEGFLCLSEVKELADLVKTLKGTVGGPGD